MRLILKSKLVIVFVFIPILCISSLSVADTIKIGIAGPFSGPYVSAGDQQWLGALQAVDDINSHGGINGNLLELVPADDVCDVKKAAAIAKRFVKSPDIRAVIGHNCSSASLVAAKIYSDANMLMITPASTTPEITELGYDSVFRTCGRDDDQSEIAAIFITKKLKAKRVVIVFDGSLYGRQVAQHTKTALASLGNKPILYQEIVHDNSNNSALINKILQLGPDLVYFGGLQTDAGNFLKYLREQGSNVTFFGSDGIASSGFVQAAGGPNMVNNVYMTFFKDPFSSSEAKKVIKELEKKHIDPTGYTLNSYAAVQAVAAAIRNSPQDQMSTWLHHNQVQTVIGKLKWNKNGDLNQAPFIVYKWNNNSEYKPYWAP